MIVDRVIRAWRGTVKATYKHVRHRLRRPPPAQGWRAFERAPTADARAHEALRCGISDLGGSARL